MKRAALLLPLLAWPGVAAAADGLLTLVIGIPMLLCLSVVLGLLLPLRSRRSVRIAAALLALPSLSFAIYVAFDAGTLFGNIGSENSMIGFGFFGLLLVVGGLFYAVARGHSGSK